MHECFNVNLRVLQFQSAPGREAGRCSDKHGVNSRGNKFQSAPGREAGRCVIYGACKVWRTGFNPRPAVRPGDANSAAPKASGLNVSIRARP